MFLYHWIGLC